MKIQVELASGRWVWFSSENIIWRCQKNGSLRIFMDGRRVGDFSKGGWAGVFEKLESKKVGDSFLMARTNHD